MSIIRQRWKNLFYSGLIGFFIAVCMMATVFLGFIRGDEAMTKQLLNIDITQIKAELIPDKEKVFTLIEPQEKGTVLQRNMLMAMEVDKTILSNDVSYVMEDIVGKALAVDVMPKTIISKQILVDQAELIEQNMETIGVEKVKIPTMLSVDEQVHVRIHFPTGQDFRVLANKRIVDMDTENSIVYIPASEEDILAYSSAYEDVNLYQGCFLYLTRVNDSQGASSDTLDAYDQYPVNPNVQHLSKRYKTDEGMLADRKRLDASLGLFFKRETTMFDYGQMSSVTKEAVETKVTNQNTGTDSQPDFQF